MTDPNAKKRCFFAIWPDNRVRGLLEDWGDSLVTDQSARRVPINKLHITLVFLGALDRPQLAAVREIGAETSWSPASLTLERIGYWQQSRVIWAGCRRDAEGLSGVVEALRERLLKTGFSVETRPFVPHVTLYRKARRRPKWKPRVVEWPVEEFTLVVSHVSSDGSTYEVLDRWSAGNDMK